MPELTPEQLFTIDLELPEESWTLDELLEVTDGDLECLYPLLRLVYFSGYVRGVTERPPWSFAQSIRQAAR